MIGPGQVLVSPDAPRFPAPPQAGHAQEPTDEEPTDECISEWDRPAFLSLPASSLKSVIFLKKKKKTKGAQKKSKIEWKTYKKILTNFTKVLIQRFSILCVHTHTNIIPLSGIKTSHTETFLIHLCSEWHNSQHTYMEWWLQTLSTRIHAIMKKQERKKGKEGVWERNY